MRTFIIWILVTVGTFALVSMGYHAYLAGSPRKCLIVVDSSFPMQKVWPNVQRKVREICTGRYTEFALITEKNRVHGWSKRCELGNVTPYAPRDFSKLTDSSQFPLIAQADRVTLITNSSDGEVRQFKGWDIVNP